MRECARARACMCVCVCVCVGGGGGSIKCANFGLGSSPRRGGNDYGQEKKKIKKQEFVFVVWSFSSLEIERKPCTKLICCLNRF